MREHQHDLKKELEEMEKYRKHLIDTQNPHTTDRVTRSQRQTLERINGHVKEVRQTATYKTAALDHAMKNEHTFNYEEPSILHKETHYKRRKGLETL